MTRTDIINHLIKKFQYTSYLEIGVRNPEDNFDLVMIPEKDKDGVDPAGRCNYCMTSDHFFDRIQVQKKYDLIFIDGLHKEAQVDRDLDNAIKHLSLNGTIVMHDCNPLTRDAQSEEYNGGTWNGTAWKSYAKLRADREFEMMVVDCDHGVGIIRIDGNQRPFKLDSNETLDYDFLSANRYTLLNLISPDKFLQEFAL